MKLILVYLRAELQQLTRVPAYVLPTLLYPTILFAFFGLPHAGDARVAPYLFASYAAISLVGVVLFQFGVGIAVERTSSWRSFMRVLPVSACVSILARTMTALIFASASIGIVALAALGFTPLHLAFERWIALGAALLVGSIPFALLGIAIGFWASPRAAVPVANLIYLPLSFIGGLWQRPADLPSYFRSISPWVPTRQYGELVWGAVAGSFALRSALALGCYACLFAALAYWGYRADLEQNYT